MNAPDQFALTMPGDARAQRMTAINWSQVADDLDTRGYAMIQQMLDRNECAAVAGLYPSDDNFRSRIVMEQHGFGHGEYKYFRYPLPDPITNLRTSA